MLPNRGSEMRENEIPPPEYREQLFFTPDEQEMRSETVFGDQSFLGKRQRDENDSPSPFFPSAQSGWYRSNGSSVFHHQQLNESCESRFCNPQSHQCSKFAKEADGGAIF